MALGNYLAALARVESGQIDSLPDWWNDKCVHRKSHYMPLSTTHVDVKLPLHTFEIQDLVFLKRAIEDKIVSKAVSSTGMQLPPMKEKLLVKLPDYVWGQEVVLKSKVCSVLRYSYMSTS
jgi:hypothetical protein